VSLAVLTRVYRKLCVRIDGLAFSGVSEFNAHPFDSHFRRHHYDNDDESRIADRAIAVNGCRLLREIFIG
jgi:hypothetical protein